MADERPDCRRCRLWNYRVRLVTCSQCGRTYCPNCNESPGRSQEQGCEKCDPDWADEEK
jgi:hypothetical protein